MKTVSAFANYNDEKIVFGVNNSGEKVKIDINDSQCLKIEKVINPAFLIGNIDIDLFIMKTYLLSFLLQYLAEVQSYQS